MVGACQTGGSSAVEPPPPPPPARSVCDPSGTACFSKAEERSEADPAGAAEALRLCLGCPDTPPAAYRLLATLHQDRSKNDEARQILLLGTRRFPSNGELLVALGRLSIGMGRTSEGISWLGQAHRLRPSDEDLADEYKNALARHGTPEDRLEAELSPLLLEATGRYELDDAKGAVDVLQQALKKSKGAPRLRALVHHRLGIVYLAAGQHGPAKEHLEAGLRDEKAPTALRAELLVSYAEVLLSVGKLAEAENAASNAIEIEPSNPLAHANLAIARAMLGDRTGAIEALEDAFEAGLARRLTLDDFMAIGPIKTLEELPEFQAMVKRVYPR